MARTVNGMARKGHTIPDGCRPGLVAPDRQNLLRLTCVFQPGPVAQLDRAMRFERRGWEFKSLRVRQTCVRSLAALRDFGWRLPLAATRLAHAANAPQVQVSPGPPDLS